MGVAPLRKFKPHSAKAIEGITLKVEWFFGYMISICIYLSLK
jgi:hypothetical protein